MLEELLPPHNHLSVLSVITNCVLCLWSLGFRPDRALPRPRCFDTRRLSDVGCTGIVLEFLLRPDLSGAAACLPTLYRVWTSFWTLPRTHFLTCFTKYCQAKVQSKSSPTPNSKSKLLTPNSRLDWRDTIINRTTTHHHHHPPPKLFKHF